MPVTRHIGAEVRSEVRGFYESVGYGGGVGDSDVVYIERRGDEIVGAARLCGEKGLLVLRGMYVAETLRGSGIGSRLLQAADGEIGNRTCWCVSYRYLSRFYLAASFVECPASEAPPFLAERCGRYAEAGADVLIMKRPATAGD